jgi:dipeptidyl aminopeptidase/acylaminoacyl peptidase
MRRLAALALALCSSLPAATFSLEQVLSAPFPSDLTASPDGKAVAWVLNERGARNVWYAAAPDFKGVRLTSWLTDDGQDLGDVRFTADGKSVIFVRGGDLEYPAQVPPNPTSDPAGTEQEIWMVSPGTPPRKVTVGHSPTATPKSSGFAFLRSGQIWFASGDGVISQLIHSRSGVSADELRWSPDGLKLAFVSERGNHSFIGVYDTTAKTLTYMDPSVDHDSNPAWSPDGKQIAFIRVFQSEENNANARATNEPWAIHVANVADGAGHQIWRADSGPGSVFHAAVTENQLFWSSDGRIVFPWEKDGWLHLYSFTASGGVPKLLTPGDFEVEHVAFSSDGREAVFSSNQTASNQNTSSQSDIDRRHIWRVAISGGSPRAVSSGDGLEWSPVAVSNGVAYLHSDAQRPARAAVRTSAGEHDLAPESVPSDFPWQSLVIPQPVTYSSSDGTTIHGQLFLPSNLKAGEKRPAVVFLHGGSRRQMLLGWHSMGYYNNAYGLNQYLANQGYIVLAINYRSGIGYGLNFREALNYGPAGGSEYIDVQGAGLYLRGRADVNGSRIGLWGGSWGGYLVAMGLAKNSDLFKAGVDFHGVHDWNIDRPVSGPVPGTAGEEEKREEKAHLAFESSPIASMKTWKSPVLLIQGDDDRNVPFANSVRLVAALRAQKVDFEQMILPDEIHGFLRHGSWLKTYAATVDFLRRKM